ncbi:hypothetical protein GQ457_18G004390 [Hibiscus cannabinus]
MEIKLNVVLCMSITLLLFILDVEAENKVIDVVEKFGAKADEVTDLSKPFLDAWKEACGSKTPTTILIPKGKYLLSRANVQGPCNAPVELQVEGTIKAPPQPKAFKEPTWVTFFRIQNLRIFGRGVFDGQGKVAYAREGCVKNDFCSHLPVNIRFDYLTNIMVEDIASKDSKQFHVNVLGCKNITFKHFTVAAPKDSPNTDGIHIGRSDGVNILNTRIKTGDDCISIGHGTKNVYIRDIVCGPGHGISIGSLGLYKDEEPVDNITIVNCIINETMTGVRIKTWPNSYPNSASNIHFENVTVNNVVWPLMIDQKYCPWNRCNLKEESKVQLKNISFKNIHGTATFPEVVKVICSAGKPCENVELEDIDIKYIGDKGPPIYQCINVKPKISGKQNPPACSTPATETPSISRKLMQ